MIQKITSVLCALPLLLAGNIQETKLPVKVWTSTSYSTVVLFISGDGGLGGFSSSLCQSLNQQGYYVTALDAKKYFWEKKTPDQTTKDITGLLSEKEILSKEQLVLVGYSFGADIVPFVVNKLPLTIKRKIKTVVLLSPSATTDFEIHVADWFGIKVNRSMNVVSEINRMNGQKVVTVFGSKEKDFPLKDITLRNFSNEVLPGGHHFDDNVEAVARTLSGYF